MIIKNIALNIKTCLSGLSFSFDELILETKTLFENEGIPGFLKLLISFIDNMVVEHWKASDEAKCCCSPHLNRSGKRSKTIITSLGNISFEWTLLKCKNCRTIHNPLKNFLGVDKNQKHSNEFENICMEAVAENSFRRSTVGIIKTNENINFNHRSLHRWFMGTDSDNISVKHDELNVVLADGTGFKEFVSQTKLERLMREIGRRIKKFAFNWSKKGCAKMTRIILKVITDPKSWENYWDNKMKLSGNIRLSFKGVS